MTPWKRRFLLETIIFRCELLILGKVIVHFNHAHQEYNRVDQDLALGGGFKHFYVHPENWGIIIASWWQLKYYAFLTRFVGKWSIFDYYFFNGLKPPTSNSCKCFIDLHSLLQMQFAPTHKKTSSKIHQTDTQFPSFTIQINHKL